MKIKQILNNNAVVILKGSNELVALASGIGFKKKIGDNINEEEVDKFFVLDTHDLVDHLSYLLSTVSDTHIMVVEKIVKYAEKSLGTSLNDYVYLSLIDHLKYAIERYEKGIQLKSPLSWEVKKLYKRELDIGLYGLDVIQEHLSHEFNQEEAVSIALHFVNIQTDTAKMNETIEMISVVQDLVNIVQYEFKIILDESDLSYIRFITHLRFFVQRVQSEHESDLEQKHDLHAQLAKMYIKPYKAVNKISHYIYNKFGKMLSEEEEVYLILHIDRVTKRTQKENINEE